MLVETNKLSGVALDYAVAIAQGATNFKFDTVSTYWVTLNEEDRALSSAWSVNQNWNPSTNWNQGGPIIVREKIAIAYEPSQLYDDNARWKALAAMSDNNHYYGPDPLIAAMRCFLASKLGDEVEIPNVLLSSMGIKK